MSRPRLLVRAAPAALALLVGCGATESELEAHLIELEVAVARVERRVDALGAIAERVAGLEALQRVPPETEGLAERLSAHDAELRRLGQELTALRRQVTGVRVALESGAGPDGEPVVITDPRSAGPGRPAAGATVKVLDAGSGDTLLVQLEGGLARVDLAGVEAPARAAVYAEDAVLRQRHQGALGEEAVASDAAFERSQGRLRDLLGGAAVSLEYPPGAAPRPGEPIAAYVRAAPEGGGEAFDVNAALVRAGYALAVPDHPRYTEYAALEREAREAGRGLFAGE